MPMAMDRALMEMMFSVLPVKYRYIRDASRAIGMDSTTMRVPFRRPRKRNTTSITTRKVMRMVSLREPMVMRILLELSTTVVIFTSAGRLRSSLARVAFTFSMTCTVL